MIYDEDRRLYETDPVFRAWADQITVALDNGVIQSKTVDDLLREMEAPK